MEGKNSDRRLTKKRRTVLKSVGGIAGGSIVGTTGATAQSGRSRVGISYDTVTHEAQRSATAKLTRKESGIVGNLSVGGFEIPFGNDSPLEPVNESGAPKFVLEQDSPRYKKNGLPLKAQFRVMGEGIVGTLTRPSAEFGKLGFTIVPSDMSPDNAVEKMSGILINGGEEVQQEGLSQPPAVPDTGIPQETSIKNIDRNNNKNGL